MNTYIKKIMSIKNRVLRQRETQKIINELISKYAQYRNNCSDNDIDNTLENIKEIVDYFKDGEINLRKNGDELLVITSLYGETDFVKWLLKESSSMHIPDINTQLTAPLRFACLNGHTDLVYFYLTDKNIEKSFINEANGCALETVIFQKNMELVKLIIDQPEINIQINHVREIFKWNNLDQREILTYIVTNKVKEKFFKKMVQYQAEMSDKIKELIIEYKFVFTQDMRDSIKNKKDIQEIVSKKIFVDRLQNKLPLKNNQTKLVKL